MGNMEQVKKKLLAASGTVLLLTVCLLTGASMYLLDYSLRPENRGKDLQGSMQYMRETYPHIVPWMDSIESHHALRDTFITAPDGVCLHAFYVHAPSPTPNTAVIVHGYTDNAIRMLHIGYLYNHDLGCNILLPDLRYTGLSGGDAMQMGWLDRKDVMQWTETAPALFGDSVRMVVHGISMGAATAMMLSGDPLPESIGGFVEDCGYTSVWDEFRKELKAQFGLPSFPLLHTASLLCKLRYGWDFHEASALGQVARCHKPMLFIHGAEDDFVPTDMVYRLYEAKPLPKSLWVVPGAAHARSYLRQPEEYTAKVCSFVMPLLSSPDTSN